MLGGEGRMTDGGSYDFPVVSEGSSNELIAAKPGTTVVEEPVYAWTGPGTYDHDEEQIGSVAIAQWKGSGGRVPFTAHFEFNDGEVVVLAGLVPGNGSWNGRGLVAYGGGSGKFAERHGPLDLESENPKRWG
jgi:hypothetical protein